MMILVCIFTYTDDNNIIIFVILRVLESKLIKHIKNKRKINRRSFGFLITRYELY